MSETIIHDAKKDADELTAPVVDIAGDLGKVTNEVGHHAETLGAHAVQIAEHETSWKNLQEQVNSLSETVMNLPSSMEERLSSSLDAVRGEIAELVKKSSSETQSSESSSAHVSPPPKTEPAKPSLGARFRDALHRLL